MSALVDHAVRVASSGPVFTDKEACPPSSSHTLSASLHNFADSAGGACINGASGGMRAGPRWRSMPQRLPLHRCEKLQPIRFQYLLMFRFI